MMESFKRGPQAARRESKALVLLSMLLLLMTTNISLVNARPSDNDNKPTSDVSSVTIRQNSGRDYSSFVGGGDLGDPYLGEFDKEWAKMSGRLQSQKCVDIPANLSLCQDIGYEQMMLPNLLQHDSLSEVTQQARSWVPLLGLHCHPDTKVFLCSLFSPVCLDRRIYPCRTLCEGVKDNCLQRMAFYGFDWPDMLQCDKFPEDNDLCIKLVHDVKPDNNCTACKHPMTYEAIVDNYCRAEFVSRVKVESTEERGQDLALILKKSKRYYKTENMTQQELNTMEPVVTMGNSCACDIVNDTSKKLLLMGGHDGDRIVVKYVVEFASNNKDFRRAFKDIRKDNVCKSIIEELSQGELEPTVDKGQEDGSCMACKLPMTTDSIVENYCLSDFVLRVNVLGLEVRDGLQTLKLKKRRKNYKKGVISRAEEKSMVPLLEGGEHCKCDLVSNPKARYLLFGSKRDDKYVINYVTEFDNKNKDFKRGLKAIRKGNACINILRGSGLGSNTDGSSPSAGKGKGGKKGRKGKKGKKGRKGKKGKKGRKGKKKGKKGKKKGKKNSGKKENGKS